MAAPTGGWVVCPVCGCVVEDRATHVLYHENPPLTTAPDNSTEENPDGVPA